MLSKSGSAAGATLKYLIPAALGAGSSHVMFNNEHVSDKMKVFNILLGAISGATVKKHPTAALSGFAMIPAKDLYL
jgi:hypothetical protein